MSAAQPYQKLLFDRSGPVSTITLNRPEVHNVLDRELADELDRAVREVRADRSRFLSTPSPRATTVCPAFATSPTGSLGSDGASSPSTSGRTETAPGA
jgi:hypothetical protein